MKDDFIIFFLYLILLLDLMCQYLDGKKLNIFNIVDGNGVDNMATKRQIP